MSPDLPPSPVPSPAASLTASPTPSPALSPALLSAAAQAWRTEGEATRQRMRDAGAAAGLARPEQVAGLSCPRHHHLPGAVAQGLMRGS